MSSPAQGRKGPRPLRGPAKVIVMPTPRVARRRRAIKAAMGLLAVALVAAIVTRLYILRNFPLSPEEIAGLSIQEAEILKRVNDERQRAGLKPLKFSPRLAVMARAHSYDMAIRHYFAHQSPEGSTPTDRVRGVGIAYRQLGENIYMDEFSNEDGLAVRALNGWLKSPEHRANMLSPSFTETGIGSARSADGKTYVTQDFLQ